MLSDDHVKDVCRRGQGAATCSFLVVTSGWHCAKEPEFQSVYQTIAVRRFTESMNAMGDNCSGPPDFIEEKE